MGKDINNGGEKSSKATFWFARIAVSVVFFLNIQCAISFLFWPECFVGAYELSGVAGMVAIQGIAVAFLMWNVTYPLVIANPSKHRMLFRIVLIQQFVGLLGESWIYLTLPDGYPLLASSIMRFIIFDGAGLLLMTAAFLAQKRTNK